MVLISAYNEISRLPAFLSWYRKLGVTQFIAIDNTSTDGSYDYLLDQEDVITIRTNASYAEAGHGSKWFNVLLERMQPGQWVIYADADECLVYEGMQNAKLPEFTRHLEEINCQSVFTPLLDLYPAGNINLCHRPDKEDFLSVPNYFHNPSEYLIRLNPSNRGPSYPNLRGGPRMDGLDPDQSPLLSKWSLFRYEPGRYVRNSHSLFPYELMAGSPKAALLHFKYSADQLSHLQSVVGEKRHGDYHEDYERYLEQYQQGVELYEENKSCRYHDISDLAPFLDAIQYAREHADSVRDYKRLSTFLGDDGRGG